MSASEQDIRECRECETLNNTSVNPLKCWNCHTTWAEQGGRIATVVRGP